MKQNFDDIKSKEITIKYYTDKDKDNYNKFLLNLTNSNIIYTLEWKKLLEKTYNFKPYYILAKDKAEQIHAVLPLFFLKNFNDRHLDSLPLSIYGGMLGKKEYEIFLLEEAIKLMKKLNCKFIAIRNTPSLVREKEYNLCLYENWYRHYIKIREPSILWGFMKKSHRNHINKALRADIKVDEVTDKDGLEGLYNLSLSTSKRYGAPPPDLKFLKNLWNIMHPKGYVNILTARYNKDLISSQMNLAFNKTVLTIYAGHNNKYRRLPLYHLIDWNTITWCYNNNYSVLDFGLTPANNRGLILYKRGFGSTENLYNYCSFPRIFSYLDGDKKINYSNKILKKMPNIVFKKFNHFINKVYA